MKIFFRKFHRWLGLLMVLQISAWMISGFYFALYPIETIRGEHLAAKPQSWAMQDLAGIIDVSTARSSLDPTFSGESLREVRLVKQGGTTK